MEFRLLLFMLVPFTLLGQSTPVDTSTRDVSYQDRKTYTIDGVHLSNEFDGARLNGASGNADTIVVTISAENQPINVSPWYAFKLWSDTPREVVLHLSYEQGLHRYYPKVSTNGLTWDPLDSSKFQLDSNSERIAFKAQTLDSVITRSKAFATVSLSSDTIWIAGQEVITSIDHTNWMTSMGVPVTEIGRSGLDKPLLRMDIGNASSNNVVLVLSRQHPPEVTGNLAARAFLETINSDSELAKRFRESFHVIAIPMMNPDGADQGHWRHNSGGVDLNRDWANLHQPETRQVSAHILEMLKSTGKKVVFGIDFHSTWKDIFYVLNRSADVAYHITEPWLNGMAERLPGFVVNDREVPLQGAGTSVRFFYQQCGADGVTYEVGDDTDRAYLKKKAEVAAISLMTELLHVDDK